MALITQKLMMDGALAPIGFDGSAGEGATVGSADLTGAAPGTVDGMGATPAPVGGGRGAVGAADGVGVAYGRPGSIRGMVSTPGLAGAIGGGPTGSATDGVEVVVVPGIGSTDDGEEVVVVMVVGSMTGVGVDERVGKDTAVSCDMVDGEVASVGGPSAGRVRAATMAAMTNATVMAADAAAAAAERGDMMILAQKGSWGMGRRGGRPARRLSRRLDGAEYDRM